MAFLRATPYDPFAARPEEQLRETRVTVTPPDEEKSSIPRPRGVPLRSRVVDRRMPPAADGTDRRHRRQHGLPDRADGGGGIAPDERT